MWSASPCLSGGTEENHEGLRIVIWDLPNMNQEYVLLNHDSCDAMGLTLQYFIVVLEHQTSCLLG